MRFLLIIASGLLMILHACYREVELEEPVSGDLRDRFELTVSPDTRDLLYTSRDTSYGIADPELSLVLNGHQLKVKRMSIRGKSALDYRRKSFSVNLEHPVALEKPDGTEWRVMRQFKLISMAMDYTYINNRLAFGIMEEAGIMPLFYKYVELSINGETQGIYFLVEDPESWAEEQGSEYILRRDYNHSIIDFEYNPARYNLPEETYRERFKSIYAGLTGDEGSTLHAYLEDRMFLGAYFTKMGIDFFLQNGDYTDEIFFYSTVQNGEIRFRIIPWDYDDIFSRNPHEVGRSWGIGTLFGPRTYPSREAIYAEIGDHLVYSIEDDLDYVIARDPYLYARYEEVLEDFFGQLTEADVEALFAEVETELAPFYGDPGLTEPSRYDRRPTSLEAWEQNMAEKKSFLLERLNWIKSELELP